MRTDDELDEATEAAIERKVAELLEARSSNGATADEAANDDGDDGANELESADAQSEAETAGKADAFSRRAVLGATGALGLTGLLGISSRTGSAAAGSIGSPSNPVDVYADRVNVGDAVELERLEDHPNRRISFNDPSSDAELFHLDADDESIVWADADTWMRGGTINDLGAIDNSGLTGDQRLESLVDGNLSIDDGALQAPSGGGGGGGGSSPDLPDNFVGEESFTLHCDPENGDDSNPGSLSEPLETIQEAVDRIPVYNARNVQIQLAEAPDLPVTYDEDVLVGPYSGYGTDGIAFRIEGDRDNPEDVRVGSMAVHNARGMQSPAIWGMTFTRENDMLSDGAGLFLYASQEPRVDSVAFDPEDGEPLEAGVEAYAGSTVNCRDVDVSGTRHGIKAKRESTVWATDTVGHAEWHVYWATEAGTVRWLHGDEEPSYGGSPYQDRIAKMDNGSICGNYNTLMVRNADMRNVHLSGDLEVDGAKNFVHELDDGTEVVYTAQESGDVRAVHEGQATVSGDGTTVSLPKHFAAVVSETEPELRVQVTPHEAVSEPVAVTERSPSELVLEGPTDVVVDYRVTGVRDGFEDEEIVRPGETGR